MHQNIAEQLWQLLDDIDTLGDALKPEQTPYTVAVNSIATKRHQLLASDGQELYWPHGQVALTLTGHEETRKIVQKKDEEGTVIGLSPVPGSERVVLHLTLPNGQVVDAQIALNDFNEHVIPFMGRTSAAFPTSYTPTNGDGFSLRDPKALERLPVS